MKLDFINIKHNISKVFQTVLTQTTGIGQVKTSCPKSLILPIIFVFGKLRSKPLQTPIPSLHFRDIPLLACRK
jgi:hypothetical protein